MAATDDDDGDREKRAAVKTGKSNLSMICLTSSTQQKEEKSVVRQYRKITYGFFLVK
jgi:hypothetical protein